jgi:hypothetical protein
MIISVSPTSRQSCSIAFQAARFAARIVSAVRELMPMLFSVLGILCMILRISRTLRWPFGAFVFEISIDARICFAACCSGAMNLHSRYVYFCAL